MTTIRFAAPVFDKPETELVATMPKNALNGAISDLRDSLDELTKLTEHFGNRTGNRLKMALDDAHRTASDYAVALDRLVGEIAYAGSIADEKAKRDLEEANAEGEFERKVTGVNG